MTRLHIHLGVSDLDRSVGFYSALFGQAPTVVKPDYAKWLLDDPSVNFAVSTEAGSKGADHFGIQLDSDQALADLSERLRAGGVTLRDEPDAACCYARSNKAWAADPENLSWELFHTTGEIDSYRSEAAGCCTPAADEKAEACCG